MAATRADSARLAPGTERMFCAADRSGSATGLVRRVRVTVAENRQPDDDHQPSDKDSNRIRVHMGHARRRPTGGARAASADWRLPQLGRQPPRNRIGNMFCIRFDDAGARSATCTHADTPERPHQVLERHGILPRPSPMGSNKGEVSNGGRRVSPERFVEGCGGSASVSGSTRSQGRASLAHRCSGTESGDSGSTWRPASPVAAPARPCWSWSAAPRSG